MQSANQTFAPHTPIAVSILRHAAEVPDGIALISGGEKVSYFHLSRYVIAAARELRGRGVSPGDRVLVEASSTLGFAVVYLAVHLSRGIAVPIDATTPRSRREFISDRVAATLALLGGDQHELMTRIRDRHLDIGRIGCEPFEHPSGNDVADVIFTSGTTGEPKGVVLTHDNLAAGACHINASVGTRADDVEVLPLPLGHSFGLGSLRSLLSVGATVVLVEGFAFPGRIYAALEEHRASSFRCVPAGLTMMLRFAPDRLADLAAHIRYVELGSAPMPLEDKRRLVELLPHSRIYMHYGLTEATRSVFIDFNANHARLSSIGKPGVGVEIRIAGPQGEAIGSGTVGEIQIRGPHVMRGYWQAPERTREAFVGEWLRTGDAGHVDDEGFLYLDGRNAEMINVGGRKVSPGEVEEALRRHPAVLDCGCSGIADPSGVSGDAVAVLVLLCEGVGSSKRDLRRHLREHLEAYKLPVKWVFSGTVPRTPNGKVQRHLLRQQLESAVGDGTESATGGLSTLPK